MTGVKLDEAVQRNDRVVVFVGLVIGEGHHELGLGRPDRIGMLAVDFFEALGGGLVILLAERIEGPVVELVDRLIDIGVFFGRKQTAGAKSQCCTCQHRAREHATRLAYSLIRHIPDPPNH